jgi:hypothetical protein
MNITAMNLSQVKNLAAVEQVKLEKSHKANEVNEATTEENKSYTSYDLTNMTGQEVLDLSHQMLLDGDIDGDEWSKFFSLVISAVGIGHLDENGRLVRYTAEETNERMASTKVNVYETAAGFVNGANLMGDHDRAEEYQKFLDKIIGIFQPEYQKPLLDVMA